MTHDTNPYKTSHPPPIDSSYIPFQIQYRMAQGRIAAGRGITHHSIRSESLLQVRFNVPWSMSGCNHGEKSGNWNRLKGGERELGERICEGYSHNGSSVLVEEDREEQLILPKTMCVKILTTHPVSCKSVESRPKNCG